MNCEKNNTIFIELYSSIKQHAEQIIPTLVDKAHQIDDILKSSLFDNRETIIDASRNV